MVAVLFDVEFADLDVSHMAETRALEARSLVNLEI
jgi:hypothetical protein